MKRLTCLLILTPAPALAHGGHWGDLAGHDHWIALGALGLAGAAGLAAVLKARKERKQDANDADPAKEAEA